MNPSITSNWRKSSRTENQGACVEVALAEPRQSKE